MFHMSREMYDAVEALGRLIASSDEYKAMKAAEAAGESDAALSACVAQFIAKRQALEAETRRDDKDFDKIGALTHELDDISGQMHALPAYQAMQQARSDFDALMQGVNEALQGIINPDVQCSCSGNCDGCAGCGQN